MDGCGSFICDRARAAAPTRRGPVPTICKTIARWSDTSGHAWSEPLDLTAVGRDMNDKGWRASVPGPGGAIQTRKGRLIVPMWKTPFANFAVFSDDHGRTWQRSQLVPGKQGGDENQLVELADGRLVMDIRQNSGSHRWQIGRAS